MRSRLLPFLFAVLSLCGHAVAATPTVRALPAQPLVERLRDGQQLNFDLLFENPGDAPLELVELQLTRFDRAGRFIGQRRLDRNGDGATMGIATVPNRALPAHGKLVVFNPFARFDADAALDRIRVEAVFAAGEDGPEQRSVIDLQPRAFVPRTRLSLPLRGEAFVHDGHDFYAHHRRLDVTGGMTTHFGITGNFMRYAHDFVVADAQGRLYRNDGAAPEDWFGYGAPVFAPGDGVVRAARDGMADNRKGAPPAFGRDALMQDLTLFLGNYVLIDHGNGEYSLLAHMRQGSVAVKPGQRVARGAQIGAMGMSGDAFLVHLHYQLQSGAGFEEGLPAYFENVRLRTGDGWSAPFDGPVDSGDVVRGAAP
ncbi:M23 family metallopeptidase [Thermomonas brevis]|uniref:M23 family metallopeptidase n=1 Tax=Thermomonas brevis TaxID=215691 RepID=A0A7G9QW13_9GAMM|nr:M23 family metallopeptidase [Thermomonas brevis]QNN47538.1 M23 family metallopeptidase [Thermomonas brevis]